MIMKIERNRLFRFNHTPTFGWSLTILSFWLVRERKYYTEKRNCELFYISYYPRACGHGENNTYWTGVQYGLTLFFIPFLYTHVTSSRELTNEDFE